MLENAAGYAQNFFFTLKVQVGSIYISLNSGVCTVWSGLQLKFCLTQSLLAVGQPVIGAPCPPWCFVAV